MDAESQTASVRPTFESLVLTGVLQDGVTPLRCVDTSGLLGETSDTVVQMIDQLKRVGLVNAFLLVFNGEESKVSLHHQAMLTLLRLCFGDFLGNAVIVVTRWYMDAAGAKRRAKSNLTEAARAKELNDMIKASLYFDGEIPVVFIDSDPEEEQRSHTREALLALDRIITSTSKFECLDIHTVRALFDLQKSQIDQLTTENESLQQLHEPSPQPPQLLQLTSELQELKKRESELQATLKLVCDERNAEVKRLSDLLEREREKNDKLTDRLLATPVAVVHTAPPSPAAESTDIYQTPPPKQRSAAATAVSSMANDMNNAPNPNDRTRPSPASVSDFQIFTPPQPVPQHTARQSSTYYTPSCDIYDDGPRSSPRRSSHGTSGGNKSGDCAPGMVYVRGYTRSNGTKVAGYYRRAPSK
jgi:hypothetical protein